jgi:hypothetical protein
MILLNNYYEKINNYILNNINYKKKDIYSLNKTLEEIIETKKEVDFKYKSYYKIGDYYMAQRYYDIKEFYEENISYLTNEINNRENYIETIKKQNTEIKKLSKLYQKMKN